jgi:hypothetical protein
MPPRPLGKVAHERGLANEKRVLEACKLEAHPVWMLRARAATRIEDRSGIDVVVVTDVGNLSIQVKSSRRGKAHFRPRPFLNVPVVVVRDGDSANVLLSKVVAVLGPIRASHLKALKKLGVKRSVTPKPKPPARAKAAAPKERPMQMPSTVVEGPTYAEASWTELRDCLLAVLLDPRSPQPMTDEGLRIAAEVLAKRSFHLDEIVPRFPGIFHRAEDGSLVTTFDLVQAYRVRLARCWEPVPRDVMRKVLACISTFVEGKEQVVLSDCQEQIAVAMKDELGESDVHRVLRMVDQAMGWEIAPPVAGSRRQVRPKPWLRNPAEAEAHLDDAAIAVMGPFAPIDRAALAAALLLASRR